MKSNSLKNTLAIWDASVDLLQEMKWVIFENLLTTTKMESWPLAVFGRPRTKSILRSYQGTWGMGRGMYRPVFYFLALDS